MSFARRSVLPCLLAVSLFSQRSSYADILLKSGALHLSAFAGEAGQGIDSTYDNWGLTGERHYAASAQGSTNAVSLAIDNSTLDVLHFTGSGTVNKSLNGTTLTRMDGIVEFEVTTPSQVTLDLSAFSANVVRDPASTIPDLPVFSFLIARLIPAPGIGYVLDPVYVQQTGSQHSPQQWAVNLPADSTYSYGLMFSYVHMENLLDSRPTANLPATITHSFDLSLTLPGATAATGFSQGVPLLPNGTFNTSMIFNNVASNMWFDPPAASGFTFEMTGDSRFTDILSLPVGLDADDQYTVVVDGVTIGTFAGGASVNLAELVGDGVQSFTVMGINPVVSTTNPTAFPIQLAFDTNFASFKMTPSTVWQPGDANLDHHIDFSDLLILAQHYNLSSGQTWNSADFDFNGAVNFDDLLVLAQRYGQSYQLDPSVGSAGFQADWELAQSLIPEPTALSALLVSPIARRRRTR